MEDTNKKEVFKHFISEKKAYVIGLGTTFALAVPNYAFATTPSISSTISGSMSQIVTDTLATFAAIAPVAITIFAAKYCWVYGKKFFANISK